MTRLRRCVAIILPALLLPALVACGGDPKPGYGDESTSGFDGVEVSGEFGKVPKLTWNSVIEFPDEVETRTLIEGDGEKVAKDDEVTGSVYIGNGTTLEKEWVYRTGMQSGGKTETVSAELGPVFEKMLEGARYGDRVQAIAPSDAVFGDMGNPQYGVGNHDALVVVLDVIKKAPPNPATMKPKDVPADQMPKLLTDSKGTPTGFDFSGVKKPKADGDLLRHVLKEGDGETVTADMQVKARYLGAVYGAKKPFDSNWSDEGFEFSMQGGVIQGWMTGLEGMKVGSRVILQIPPALAYGEQEQAGIPANSTLYFVIEIVSASKE